MSRIGKKEIVFDSSVKVDIKDNQFSCQGAKGRLSLKIPSGVSVNIKENKILLSPKEADKNSSRSLIRLKNRQNNASWGTTRQLISNSIIGVTDGFQRTLILEGVGFRASVAGKKLTLSIGFSHPIEYQLPEGIKATVASNTKVTIDGCDKHLVGKVASEIRAFRRCEPYKGKGIKYSDEVIRRKAGKTGKK